MSRNNDNLLALGVAAGSMAVTSRLLDDLTRRGPDGTSPLGGLIVAFLQLAGLAIGLGFIALAVCWFVLWNFVHWFCPLGFRRVLVYVLFVAGFFTVSHRLPAWWLIVSGEASRYGNDLTATTAVLARDFALAPWMEAQVGLLLLAALGLLCAALLCTWAWGRAAPRVGWFLNQHPHRLRPVLPAILFSAFGVSCLALALDSPLLPFRSIPTVAEHFGTPETVHDRTSRTEEKIASDGLAVYAMELADSPSWYVFLKHVERDRCPLVRFGSALQVDAGNALVPIAVPQSLTKAQVAALIVRCDVRIRVNPVWSHEGKRYEPADLAPTVLSGDEAVAKLNSRTIQPMVVALRDILS